MNIVIVIVILTMLCKLNQNNHKQPILSSTCCLNFLTGGADAPTLLPCLSLLCLGGLEVENV